VQIVRQSTPLLDQAEWKNVGHVPLSPLVSQQDSRQQWRTTRKHSLKNCKRPLPCSFWRRHRSGSLSRFYIYLNGRQMLHYLHLLGSLDCSVSPILHLCLNTSTGTSNCTCTLRAKMNVELHRPSSFNINWASEQSCKFEI